MVSSEKFRSLPVWALCGLIAVAVLAIGFTVWHEFTGGSAAAPPGKTVHPGMYDFRKEAQSGNLGRRTNTQ